MNSTKLKFSTLKGWSRGAENNLFDGTSINRLGSTGDFAIIFFGMGFRFNQGEMKN